MSRGLYTVAEIARYFGSRAQDVARMIEEDALPAVRLPGPEQLVKKITLHGLHGWLKTRHSGSAFMSVEELAEEIERANAPDRAGVLALPADGVSVLRAAVETVFESIKIEMERKKAA